MIIKPKIDHIQITVRDLEAAEEFYDGFLKLVGFDTTQKTRATIEEHDFKVIEYAHPELAIALTSPRQAFEDDDVNRRKPGALHHLAFRASSRAEVDQCYRSLKKLGATIVSPPRDYPEYSPPGYYAVFFKDPDGIKYEIVNY